MCSFPEILGRTVLPVEMGKWSRWALILLSPYRSRQIEHRLNLLIFKSMLNESDKRQHQPGILRISSHQSVF